MFTDGMMGTYEVSEGDAINSLLSIPNVTTYLVGPSFSHDPCNPSNATHTTSASTSHAVTSRKPKAFSRYLNATFAVQVRVHGVKTLAG
eukprot:9476275-Pyramimonas_sp.AAC.4